MNLSRFIQIKKQVRLDGYDPTNDEGLAKETNEVLGEHFWDVFNREPVRLWLTVPTR